MDFFERQVRARQQSRWLVLIYLAAIVGIIGAVSLVAYFTFNTGKDNPGFSRWLVSRENIALTLFIVMLIFGGTLLRFLQLRTGGDAVAELVGARPLNTAKPSPEQRVLINVVAEMSIAAGIPAPSLYILENEHTINAFVAGYDLNQAAMVVTAGTLKHLNRDQLQGVVGHEFSHILNGDMRLNIRLLSLLAGILMLSKLGELLARSGSGRSRRGNSGLVIAGFALMAIGYVGQLSGRMLQAAVSRQREFLADASAVQFTRNPTGIGEALFTILNSTGHSRLLYTRNAQDVNHMAFGETVGFRLDSWLASHPPLEERIDAIAPDLLVRLKSRHKKATRKPEPQKDQAIPYQPATKQEAAAGIAALAAGVSATQDQPAQPRTDTISNQSISGQVTPSHFEYAQALIKEIPSAVFYGIQETGQAQIIAALLVLQESPASSRNSGYQLIETYLAGLRIDDEIKRLIGELSPQLRFPLLELLVPKLREMSSEQKDRFLLLLDELVKLDNRQSLFEFLAEAFITLHLAPKRPAALIRFHSANQLQSEIIYTLNCLARTGGSSAPIKETAFLRALSVMGFTAPFRPELKFVASKLTACVERINQLHPFLKRSFLMACVDCVSHDGKIDAREYELVRLIADMIQSPLPPLLTNVGKN